MVFDVVNAKRGAEDGDMKVLKSKTVWLAQRTDAMRCLKLDATDV